MSQGHIIIWRMRYGKVAPVAAVLYDDPANLLDTTQS